MIAHLNRFVWVTHRFVGFHQWPDAPVERAYLSFPHRHVFHVTATVKVMHDDREVEFHDLLAQLTALCDELKRDELGSCEQIAGQLATALAERYPNRYLEVEVSEDGENGATLIASPMR